MVSQITLIPELVVVSAGEFSMGGIAADKFVTAIELPRHEVVFPRGYAMGKSPVTRGEWRALMGALPCHNPPWIGDDCPVVAVTFSEVMEYLGELSAATGSVFRLPSEAEWERACRAGSSTVFPHGKTLRGNDANFLYDEHGKAIGSGKLTPVGIYPENAFGFVDLLGNACEWTADVWHPGYEGAPDDGSAWTRGGKPGYRVIRGGAWDHLPRVLRASWRDRAPEDARWDNLGFRVARDL